MLNIGEKFGLNDRYEITKLLGEGGMGEVYMALDTILKESVAIKTLNSKLALDQSVKNRFLNEAKVCLTLTHPNIIRVRDVNIYNDIYYMVMEYIQGVELKEIMPTLDRDDVKSLYKMIKPVFQALEYAHNYTIHRDIKSANIMIKDDKAYLMDFGISKALEDSEISNDTIMGGMGTKKYVSPEQAFNANDVDKRTDIYSMGVLFYELLTLNVPKNTAVQEPEKPSKFNQNISPELDNIILKMIESKPSNRQENFTQIIAQCDNALLNENTPSKTVTTVQTQQVNEVVFQSDIDLTNMVKVEEGNYLRGSGNESKIMSEKPRKPVFVDTFYISKYCVTNEEYKEFLDATQYEKPQNFDENLASKPNHPVVFVSQDDALAYCKYKGCSLPSEAQWEKAAKGGQNLIYPWGNSYEYGKANIEKLYDTTCNVNDLEAGQNPYGLYNLSGNVWEWCADDFIEDFYKKGENKNPLANEGKEEKVLRGGAFDFPSVGARTSFRFHAKQDMSDNNIGFRVVKNG